MLDPEYRRDGLRLVLGLQSVVARLVVVVIDGQEMPYGPMDATKLMLEDVEAWLARGQKENP